VLTLNTSLEAVLPRTKRKPVRGRPRLPDIEAKRGAIGLRVTSELRSTLEKAAAKSGRSMSQEAEFRLEQSFHSEQQLGDAMRVAFGGKRAAAVFLSLAAAADAIDETLGGKGWLDDLETFATVRNVWNDLLERLSPQPPQNLKSFAEEFGVPFTSMSTVLSEILENKEVARLMPREVAEAKDTFGKFQHVITVLHERASGDPAFAKLISPEIEIDEIVTKELAKTGSDRSKTKD
jgi:hypothetical protein